MEASERRKIMGRSPGHSSGSIPDSAASSSSPLPPLSPRSAHRLDKSFSGGSSCSSQGYSCGGGGSASGSGHNSRSTCRSTSATNLTVPDLTAAAASLASGNGGTKVNRSTSPLSFTARLRKRKEKKLQKQEHFQLILKESYAKDIYNLEKC